jgi:hypothetical protein
MRDCFIIMPVTTPPELYPQYGNDPDHFKHVLDYLFVPALQRIGYTGIPPLATGADLIHAEIIKQLGTAELVLCDISTLNSNVFFELGIRTALDMPVSMVKDTFTEAVPFDATIINHHTYDASLEPWILSNEIQRMSDHLLQSVNRSENRNTLWKYFGLTEKALMSSPGSALEQKIDYIIVNLEAMRQFAAERVATPSTRQAGGTDLTRWIVEQAQVIASEYSAKLKLSEAADNFVTLDLGPFGLPEHSINSIEHLGDAYGIRVRVIGGDSTFGNLDAAHSKKLQFKR